MSKKSAKPSILTAADILKSWTVNPKAVKLTVLEAQKRSALAAAKAPAAKAPAAKAPKAPKAKQPRGTGLVERYLDKCSAEFSESYVKSLQGPLTSFIEWCASKGITQMAQVETKTLEAYRRHAENQGRALSTTRMALARVQTFLRFAGCTADLTVLRVQHTKKEKKHLADLAEQRAEAV